MENIINTKDPKVTLFREDIINRLASAEENLLTLRNNTSLDTANYVRLDGKAAAVRKALDEDGERMLHVETQDDIVMLAALVKAKGEDGPSEQGTQLVVDYMLGYIR